VRTRSLALAVLVFALTAAPAGTAPVALGGSPLNVQVDQLGQLQAVRAGTNGIFFPSSSVTGDAGFFLAVPAGPTVYGFDGTAGPHGLTDYTAVSPGAVTGTGTAADPLTLITRYDAGAAADVEQTTTYVNGSQQFRVHWKVTNTSAAPLAFKAIAAADFYFEGSDRGTGIFTQGPPRFIGGTNADTGNSGGLEEVLGPGLTPWSDYQALAYGGLSDQVWGKVEGAADATTNTFDNTVVGDSVDNAGAVEWNLTGGSALGIGASADFELVVRNAVPAALQLHPTNAGAPQGVPVNIAATAVDTNGQPYAGRTLRWTTTGVNPGSGSAILGAAGGAVITDPGTNAGADTIVAFVDFNNNGVREGAEPQASALATFVDNIDPRCTLRVTGDRPGGGGAGKPLTINVNCSETARVTVSTSLIAPAARASALAQDAAKKTKPKRKKKVTIKLKARTVTVAPGKALPVKLTIPKKIARKYAGRSLKAKITIRATDSAGNLKKATATRTVKLAKLKKKKPRKRRG
jgi:hypothetical protein